VAITYDMAVPVITAPSFHIKTDVYPRNINDPTYNPCQKDKHVYDFDPPFPMEYHNSQDSMQQHSVSSYHGDMVKRISRST
jgi:hypothetical protein